MIPNSKELRLPILKFCEKGSISIIDLVEVLGKEFKLSEENKESIVPSGGENLFKNKVNWARKYLKEAGLLIYERSDPSSITEKGKLVLTEIPKMIDDKFLEQFQSFVDFKNRKDSRKPNE